MHVFRESFLTDELEELVYETTELSAQIYNLQKFTNYTLSVVAYTRIGEGVRSEEKFVRTEQDGMLTMLFELCLKKILCKYTNYVSKQIIQNIPCNNV